MASWVMITGATGGFGRALAAACAARGWDLYLTDIAAAPLDALALDICREYGVRAVARPCDLTDPAARAVFWERIAAQGLVLWMQLNVAGMDYQGPFAQRDLHDLLAVARLHVEAVIAMCHGALRHRDPTRTLRLVNIASFAAFFPMPGKAVYAASKRFILDFSRALHEELRPHDASVTAVCPTGMPTTPRAVAGIEALGRWGRLTGQPVDRVAAHTLDAALRGRPLYVPGLLNRAIRAASALAPLPWRLRWIGRRWGRRLDDPGPGQPRGANSDRSLHRRA